MSKTLITTLNWNQRAYTEELLDSINPLKGEFDVLVIDNGSKSEEIVKEDKKRWNFKLDFLNLDSNYGFTGGFNKGIQYFLEKKEYEYIIIINNDVVVDKSFLNEFIKLSETVYKNTDYIMAPKIYYQDFDGAKDVLWFGGGEYNKWNGKTKHKNSEQKDTFKNEISEDNGYLTGCCFFIPRCTMEKLNGFDGRYFLYCEDLDMSLRTKGIGGKLVYNPNSIIWHKVGRHFRSYPAQYFFYLLRNSFWTAKKNLNPIFFISQILYFIFITQFYLCAKGLIKAKSINYLITFYKGALIGIFT